MKQCSFQNPVLCMTIFNNIFWENIKYMYVTNILCMKVYNKAVLCHYVPRFWWRTWDVCNHSQYARNMYKKTLMALNIESKCQGCSIPIFKKYFFLWSSSWCLHAMNRIKSIKIIKGVTFFHFFFCLYLSSKYPLRLSTL